MPAYFQGMTIGKYDVYRLYLISCMDIYSVYSTYTQRLSAESRRQQLTDIAITLTARKGFGQASHSDIAKEAEVAVSTVFFYFPSVNQLHDAIIDEIEELLTLTSIIRLLDNYDTSYPFSVFNHQLELIDSNKNKITNIDEKIIIIIQWNNLAKFYDFWPRFKQLRKKYKSTIGKIINKARKQKIFNETIDRETAIAMFSAIHRLVFTMHFTGEDQQAIEEIIKAAHKHLFK